MVAAWGDCRELPVVGVGFAAAVFVTYFLLGLGLLGAIKSFFVSHGISARLQSPPFGGSFVLRGDGAWWLLNHRAAGTRPAGAGGDRKPGGRHPPALMARAGGVCG